MSSTGFWLLFAFGILEVFFATSLVHFSEKDNPEVTLSTPWIALIQLPVVAAFLLGLIEVYEGSILGLILIGSLSLAAIIVVIVYIRSRRKREFEPVPLISNILYLGFFLVSIAILISVIVGLATSNLEGMYFCEICRPRY